MKVKLIFRNSFIAPVPNSKMEHTYKTFEVDVPDYFRGNNYELIGGEYEQPERICITCKYINSSMDCICNLKCDNNNSQWKPKETP